LISQIYYSYIQTSNRKQEKERAINVYYRKTMWQSTNVPIYQLAALHTVYHWYVGTSIY